MFNWELFLNYQSLKTHETWGMKIGKYQAGIWSHILFIAGILLASDKITWIVFGYSVYHCVQDKFTILTQCFQQGPLLHSQCGFRNGNSFKKLLRLHHAKLSGHVHQTAVTMKDIKDG